MSKGGGQGGVWGGARVQGVWGWGADPSKPHASRATVVSSQLLAHEGMPLTSLYEHMSPETLPFSKHAWRRRRARVDGFPRCGPRGALRVPRCA